MRHHLLLPLLLPLAAAAFAQTPAKPKVALGIDVLERQKFAPLADQRVGLITNPTGVAGDLRATIDILHAAPNVKLVALFGPEHGVRGDAAAGDKVEDTTDAITGLPAISLYGKTRQPTAEMLADIDTLVFDIQDIGSRSYTYISTLAAAMEGAAQHGKRVVVLDRPNPVGGQRIEGRVLDLKYKSFVGYLPIPYLHGMTVGELALMANGEGWLEDGRKCDLQVIAMDGWRRDMEWEDTALTWVPTSPHVPRADSSRYYAATGIIGELNLMNIGVGYTLPFELMGMPGLNPQQLADELNRRKLAGVTFRPLYFTPFYSHYKGETCAGVQILFTDRKAAELTPLQFHVVDALRKQKPGLQVFDGKRDAMFDKVCGTDWVRRTIEAGRPVDEVLAVWNKDVEQFRQQREKYLLYK